MHTQRPDPWKERLLRSGYLLGAILLHLIVFLLVATLVIWKAPPPPPNDVFRGVAIKTAPPPPQPPSSGEAANNPQFEPQQDVVPVVTPASVITTANSTFTVDTSKVLDQALSHFSDQTAKSSGLSSGGGGTNGTGNGFGSFTGSSAQLSGYLIDLKQTGKRQPTGMNMARYYALLSKYINQGWDDSFFDSYYKSKAPIYTNDYAITTRPSGEGPKAFGLEKEVQPGLWVIHYHARVEAPQAGEYRLVGFADNVLMVKIRGETVLDGGWNPLTSKAILHQIFPYALPSYISVASKSHGSHDAHLKIGPAFRVDNADPVDMDVLIGDDGGICSFFLLIERVGNMYEETPDGTPRYPFFQLGTGPAPILSDNEEHPPYGATPEPWSGAP